MPVSMQHLRSLCLLQPLLVHASNSPLGMSRADNLYGLLFNAKSIVNKLSELHYLLYCTNVDIFVITETWLPIDIMSILLDSKGLLTVLRKDRIFLRGGGVCVLVRKPLCVISINLGNEFDDLEMICFDLNLTGNHTRFFALYRPPGYDSELVMLFVMYVSLLNVSLDSKVLNTTILSYVMLIFPR